MATFIVLKDRFESQHAAEIHGEANTGAIKATALEAALRHGIQDEGETLLVGIVSAREACEARLKREEHDGDGGIVWLYWMAPDGTFESTCDEKVARVQAIGHAAVIIDARSNIDLATVTISKAGKVRLAGARKVYANLRAAAEAWCIANGYRLHAPNLR